MAYNLSNTAAQIDNAIKNTVLQQTASGIGPTGTNTLANAAFCIQSANKNVALYVANTYTTFYNGNTLGFNVCDSDARFCLYTNRGFVFTDNSATFFCASGAQLRFGTNADRTTFAINNKKLGLGTESPSYNLEIVCYAPDNSPANVIRVVNTSTGTVNQGSLLSLATRTSGNNATEYYYNYEVRASNSNPITPYAYRGGNTPNTYDDSRYHFFRGCNNRIKLMLLDDGSPGSFINSRFVSFHNTHCFVGSGEKLLFNLRNCLPDGALENNIQNFNFYAYNRIYHKQFVDAGCSGSSIMVFSTSPTGDITQSREPVTVLTLSGDQCAYFNSGVSILQNLNVTGTITANNQLISRGCVTRLGGDSSITSGYHYFSSITNSGERLYHAGYGFNQNPLGLVTEHQMRINGCPAFFVNANSLTISNSGCRGTTSPTNINIHNSNNDTTTQCLNFVNSSNITSAYISSRQALDGTSAVTIANISFTGPKSSTLPTQAIYLNANCLDIYRCLTVYNCSYFYSVRSASIPNAFGNDTGSLLAYSGSRTYLLNNSSFFGSGGFVFSKIVRDPNEEIRDLFSIDGCGRTYICTRPPDGEFDNNAVLNLTTRTTSLNGGVTTVESSCLKLYPCSTTYNQVNPLICKGDAAIIYDKDPNQSNIFAPTASGFVIGPRYTVTNLNLGLRVDQFGSLGVGIKDPSSYGVALSKSSDSYAQKTISVGTCMNTLTFGSYSKDTLSHAYISARSVNNDTWARLFLQPVSGTVYINETGLGSICSGNYVLLSSLEVMASNSNIQNRANISITNCNARGSGFLIAMNSGNCFQIMSQSGIGVFMTNGGNSWSSISDERTKDIIEYITGASEKISTLRTVIGKYKSDSPEYRRPFLIAQDMEKVFPEAVINSNSESELLGLSYTDTIPLIIAAIKEMKIDIDNIKRKLGI